MFEYFYYNNRATVWFLLIVPKCGVSALRVIEKAAYFSITNTRNRISSDVLFVRETNKKPDGRNFTRCRYTKIERIFGRVVCRRTRRSNKWTGGRWNSFCGENRASSYGKGEYFWDGGRVKWQSAGRRRVSERRIPLYGAGRRPLLEGERACLLEESSLA